MNITTYRYNIQSTHHCFFYISSVATIMLMNMFPLLTHMHFFLQFMLLLILLALILFRLYFNFPNLLLCLDMWVNMSSSYIFTFNDLFDLISPFMIKNTFPKANLPTFMALKIFIHDILIRLFCNHVYLLTTSHNINHS